MTTSPVAVLRGAHALIDKGFTPILTLRPLSDEEKESRAEAEHQAWFMRTFGTRGFVNRYVYGPGPTEPTHYSLEYALMKAAGGDVEAYDAALRYLEAVIPYGFVDLWTVGKTKGQTLGILNRARARAEAEERANP